MLCNIHWNRPINQWLFGYFNIYCITYKYMSISCFFMLVVVVVVGMRFFVFVFLFGFFPLFCLLLGLFCRV